MSLQARYLRDPKIRSIYAVLNPGTVSKCLKDGFHQKLTETAMSREYTWCHQNAGMKRISPGVSITCTGLAAWDFGNFLRSGASMLT